ncbi:MAG: S41 family peptidase [Fimbriimonadales bacterium]|nr:S41 family peptidase [Fimbriimonadales bacterium]
MVGRKVCPALLLLLASSTLALELRRAQEPSLSPDGSKIAFVWQGDVWVAPSEGGQARRLTVHPAEDASPIWTADGERIVFASNRSGMPDLYSMAADGSDIRRLTFDPASQTPVSVSRDGRWIYGTTNAWGSAGLFRLPVQGGEPTRLTSHPLELFTQPAVSPDGSRVAYTKGSAGAWRNPYASGSAAGDIFVADIGAPLRNHRTIAATRAAESSPNWLPDGSIVFLSNRSGWPNLWSMDAQGGRLRQLTRFAEGGVPRRPKASLDGGKVVFEHDSRIWLLDAKTGKAGPVSIAVPDDERSPRLVRLTLSEGVSEYAVSPDAKRIVAAVRGDLWLLAASGGLAKRLTENPGYDGQPVFLTNKRIAYVAMDEGRRRILAMDLDQAQPKALVEDDRDCTLPTPSPDGKLLAYVRAGRELRVVPAEGGEARTLAEGSFYEALRGGRFFSWSPDSEWIVFENANERSSTLEMVRADGGRRVVVGRVARGVIGTPRFTPDAQSVYFLAQEYEEPNLFAIDLYPPDRTFPEDALERLDDPRPRESSPKVRLLERGIEGRMRRLTTEALSAALAQPDGRGYLVVSQGRLATVPSRGGAPTPLTASTAAPARLEVFAKRVYGIVAGRVAAIGADGAAQPVAFTADAEIDADREFPAFFEEIGWAMDRFYYRGDLNLRDWGAIRKRYEPLVPFASDRADFYAMMNEMMQELGSSHLGASAPSEPNPPTGQETGAWLGCDFAPTDLEARGVYRVERVYAGGPADHPESELRPGDVLLEVDGQKPGPSQPLSRMLVGKAGRKVKLAVDRGGRRLEVLAQPEPWANASRRRYEAWVEFQRRETDRLSGGKLAYFHIQGMNDPSYREFLRAIRTETPGKSGMLLDVRFNGGGNTSHLILGVLIKTPWLVRTTRGAEGIRVSENIYRGDALELPTGLLINQASFSNAEIFAEGFRRLKLGPIVGVETAGGVIGTGAYGLWDGGSIRMPGSGAYAIDGENLEGQGRKPDIAVPFDADLWEQGRDSQLERLVQEMLRILG